MKDLRTAVLMLLSLTVLTGCLYPALVTCVAQVVFPYQANGSLMVERDIPVGSELIGQPFSDPRYFWGRLSATSPVPYNAAASSGSNFGPLHPDLKSTAQKRITALTAGETSTNPIPVDLVTASGSGLDPQISPASAEFQVSRVAKARGLADDVVRELVIQHTKHRQFGVLGEPRVDVLRLNLALDRLGSQE